ncbi:MAG: RNA methyltransferase [Eubacteriales bacterium]|nr:RNA methyltransferase [Eubacteriales bacterium]
MINIIKITEYDSTDLDVYARDTERELSHHFEPDGGLFIAESPKIIERALDAGCEPVSMLLEPKYLPSQNLTPGPCFGAYIAANADSATLAAAAANDAERIRMKAILSRIDLAHNIPVYTADLSILMKIIGYKLTNGALCAMRRPVLPSLDQMLKFNFISRMAVLCNIENPANVGAIFRNAAALGMDAVAITRDSADPLYRRAIRVSMGTVFQIPWTYIDDIAELKHYGFELAAMALDEDSININDRSLCSEEKLAVILGNEGEGLPAADLAKCGRTVMIPMSHEVDSLNVAAASAVAFWELCRRRHSE